MGGIFSVLYGGIAYLIFLGAFLYAAAFVGNLGPWNTIDSGAASPTPVALLIDSALLALFAIQHSVMARPAFKRAWTRIVPKAAERSTFVLLASLVLIVMFWQWRPITTPVWTVTAAPAAALRAVFWLGWGLVLLSTFLINHFELFGLSQVYARLRGHELDAPTFRTPFVYRWVRHPIYLGFLLAFWATPAMTAGHLLFSVATTGYILLGIFLEERDLVAQFGEQYRHYRSRVGMLFPLPGGNR
jgi:methanethiol S-methyltransferase